MSQTTQVISIPLLEGKTTAYISATAWGVGGARLENDEIVFEAGPDLVGARLLRRNVIVQDIRKLVPEGYKSAGEIDLGSRKIVILVELPD